MSKRTVAVAMVSVLLMGAGGSPAPVATETLDTTLLPHRALYKMSLESARNGSAVTGANGLMYYQWSDACDGWMTEQRFETNFVYNEAEDANISTTYTTWESKDGTQYRFNVRRKTNGQLEETYKGTASIPVAGKAGVANFVAPETSEVKIPAGSYFPTAHTLALLSAAKAKKPLFAATVFDGSEGEGLSEISAAIGAIRPVSGEIAITGRGDKPAVMWPVRMAFFTNKSDEAEPEYEMDSTMLPNGVTESMLLDYGDFKLRATLEKVELLPEPKC